MAWLDTSNALRLTDVYVEGFRKRLFPIFDDIGSEATAAAEAYERDVADLYPQEMMWDAHLDAFEHGWDRFSDLDFVRRQLIGLGIAGLFHLWERLVINLITQQLPTAPQRQGFKDICKNLKTIECNITTFKYFEDLDTLQLVTNTIKHGDGPSCRKLYQKEPQLFENYHASMTADHLGLNVEHFDRFTNAVRSFWTWMHKHLVEG